MTTRYWFGAVLAIALTACGGGGAGIDENGDHRDDKNVKLTDPPCPSTCQ